MPFFFQTHNLGEDRQLSQELRKHNTTSLLSIQGPSCPLEDPVVLSVCDAFDNARFSPLHGGPVSLIGPMQLMV